MKIDVNKPETATDEPTVTEYFFNFFRCCVGGDIEIFRGAIEQKVTYTAACEERCVPGVFQAVENFECGGADLFATDVVVGSGYNFRFHTDQKFFNVLENVMAASSW
jgi:hypothetical protein